MNVNSIRVYQVDPSKNHDACMKELEKAGIYLVLDLPNPEYSIDRTNPHFDIEMSEKYLEKIKAFIKYKYFIGVIVGNEVTNDKETTPASAFVKSAVKYVKSYLKSVNTGVFVGYADNDDPFVRENMIKYFNCGNDAMARVDFYGINTYRWCGNNGNSQIAGYDDLLKPFKEYDIPVILTEYGCNIVRPRDFKEAIVVTNGEAENVLSGGFVYEYSQEDNNYGLVKLGPNGFGVSEVIDGDRLARVYATPSKSNIKMNSYDPELKHSECPEVSDNWRVAPIDVPIPNRALCDCMFESLECTLNPKNSHTDEAKKEVSSILQYQCGINECKDIATDTEKGNYGVFSMCSPIQRASYIMNSNYIKHGRQASMCSNDKLNSKIIQNPKIKIETCMTKTESEGGNESNENIKENRDNKENNDNNSSKEKKRSGSQKKRVGNLLVLKFSLFTIILLVF
ncbi:hypothetical protein BB560_001793 [Smittium megazygosporum]|uniref:1,3-beta-glucanosyltransferase n=1 Tax=Smittium megazygosporum TaxID=133381 RepID=A0A2T9ZGL1_9FUNG|nr:hypothetical protein BB560_001793 [Smittium megazygosporum]